MVTRNLKPAMLVVLFFVFAIPAYATSCAVPTVEDVVAWGREAQSNSFDKGFLISLILTTYVLNVSWFIYHTKRWIIAILASLVVIPVSIPYFFAEIMSGGCSFSGIAARYYAYPAGVLILLFVFQIYRTQKDRRIISIA